MEQLRKLDPLVFYYVHTLNRAAKAKYLVQRFLRKPPQTTLDLPRHCLEEIVDLTEYLNISLSEFIYLSKKWGEYVSTFTSYTHPQDFYLAWKEDMGKANLCANLLNQIFPYCHIYTQALSLFSSRSMNYCDYGCGTGTFSFILNQYVPFSVVHFFDVPNASRDYIQFKIQKHKKANMAWFDVLKEPTHETSYDLIACLDVLEHLPRASQAFEAIDSMLRPNGHLILSAPWGGYPEHIPAAAIDFYRGNGFHLLKTKYKLIAHFGRIHLNGIYKKK